MADIIDFRAKSKLYRNTSKMNDSQTKLGQIILFSGVRIQRDEIATPDDQLNKSSDFLTSQSN